MSKYPEINVSLPLVSKTLDSAIVNSVAQYIQLEQLLRSLITYSSSGNIEGDLARSWIISKDYTEFQFRIKDNQKFSDGTKITANDFKKTLERNGSPGGQIHYNFTNIESIAVPEELLLVIKLKSPAPFFIYLLDAPEFRLLHKSDYTNISQKQTFTITSGAYHVHDSASPLIYDLNKFYEMQNKETAPKSLQLHDIESTEPNIDSLKKMDIVFLSPSTDIKFVKTLANNGLAPFKTRLAFSYWLSLSNAFTKQQRFFLQQILTPTTEMFKDNIFIEKALQLYLPYGPGRLSHDDIKSLQKTSDIKPTNTLGQKSIKILLSEDYHLTNYIKSQLSKNGIKADFTYYKNFDEYADIIKKIDDYDVVQANNDFSAVNLRESLNVSFLPTRPLIHAFNDSSITKLLEEINKTADTDITSKDIKKIGEILLTEGHIIPQFYFYSVILHKDEFSMEKWSLVYPEFSLWKIKNLKK